MVRETADMDISGMPEVARLAREVARTGKRQVLREDGKAVAVIAPVRVRRPPKTQARSGAQTKAVVATMDAWEGPADSSQRRSSGWVPSPEGLERALAAAGGWQDLVDTEKLKADIKHTRGSRRPPIRL